MSAVTDYISKKWIDWVFALFISSIGTIFLVSATRSDLEKKEFLDKVNNAASVDYVNSRIDERIISHEQKEEARYKGIQDMFMMTNDRLKEIQADIRELNSKR